MSKIPIGGKNTVTLLPGWNIHVLFLFLKEELLKERKEEKEGKRERGEGEKEKNERRKKGKKEGRKEKIIGK